MKEWKNTVSNIYVTCKGDLYLPVKIKTLVKRPTWLCQSLLGTLTKIKLFNFVQLSYCDNEQTVFVSYEASYTTVRERIY